MDGWGKDEGSGDRETWGIVAQPDVWSSDIHLTDWIIVQNHFQQTNYWNTGFSVRLCPSLALASPRLTAQGDFEGLREERMPALIANTSALLIDRLPWPAFSLVSTDSNTPSFTRQMLLHFVTCWPQRSFAHFQAQTEEEQLQSFWVLLT